MEPIGVIDKDGTLDSNVIGLLTKIIVGSIYNNTNRTAEQESSSTRQIVPATKIEPQIVSGN
ncbi:MAG TPA: hypothetical protein VF233_11470 [Nitrososphaeraceae archaeon]